jgi:hypothetical protein
MSKSKKEVFFCVDWESDTITINEDRKFSFWWEDMRRREVLNLIEAVYMAGYEDGKKTKDEQENKLYEDCTHPSPPPIRILNEDGSPGKDEVSEKATARIRGRAFQMNLEAERLTDPRRDGRFR